MKLEQAHEFRYGRSRPLRFSLRIEVTRVSTAARLRRQLLLLVLMQQAEATADATGTDDQPKILHELITALATVDPGKLDWTDD